MGTQNYLQNFLTEAPVFLTLSPDTPLSPFAWYRGVKDVVGEPRSMKRLKSGDFLIEVRGRKEAEKLMAKSELAGVGVKVELHRGLNRVLGVFSSRDFDDVEEDEMLANLASQGVTKVKRLTFRRRNSMFQSVSFLATFSLSVLPKEIKLAYTRAPVRPWIPNPLRCYNCQEYGHGRDNCRKPGRCEQCGERGHTGDSCEATEPMCVNCSNASKDEVTHASNSRECPVWKLEKKIMEVKIREKVSYPEARRAVIGSTKKTYSQAVNLTVDNQGASRTTVDSACQTDPLPVGNCSAVTNSAKGTSEEAGSPRCSSSARPAVSPKPVLAGKRSGPPGGQRPTRLVAGLASKDGAVEPSGDGPLSGDVVIVPVKRACSSPEAPTVQKKKEKKIHVAASTRESEAILDIEVDDSDIPEPVQSD